MVWGNDAIAYKVVVFAYFLGNNESHVFERHILNVRCQGGSKVMGDDMVADKTVGRILLVRCMGNGMEPRHFHRKENDKEEIGDAMFYPTKLHERQTYGNKLKTNLLKIKNPSLGGVSGLKSVRESWILGLFVGRIVFLPIIR